MVMHMTLARTSNIDYNKMKFINDGLISKYSADWNDTIEVLDIKDGEKKFINVKDISLYNHRLIMFNDQWHIIEALSK